MDCLTIISKMWKYSAYEEVKSVHKVFLCLLQFCEGGMNFIGKIITTNNTKNNA